MKYEKEYRETLEQLYFATREIEAKERHEEICYQVLANQGQAIDEIHSSIEKLTGERLEKWEKLLSKMIRVYYHLGHVYMSELKWRKMLKEKDKALLEAADRISELENQLKAIEEC